MLLNTLTTFLAFNLASAALLPRQSWWKPKFGDRWQIILNYDINKAVPLIPNDAKVWDLDLFLAPTSTIDYLHSKGAKVICYFSAGTVEDWQSDAKSFPAEALGDSLASQGWKGETYVDIRRSDVFEIMKKRIDLAKQKGCDAVDPDNIDIYSNDKKLGITEQDAAAFQRKMSNYAHDQGLAIGLKNAQSILSSLLDVTDFAVNESCVKNGNGECDEYAALIRAGKPVYSIEYGTAAEKEKLCQKAGPGKGNFDTVIKRRELDGWVTYCGAGSTTFTTSTV